MANNYRTYLCLTTHYNGRLFKAGLIYYFVTNPGSKFQLINSDEPNRAGIDPDNTWFPGPIGYDDFTFELTQAKLGVLDKPDYDYTEMGLAFPQNDTAEVAYLSRITPHRASVGRDVIWYPHFHYIQDEAEEPVFEYRRRISCAGEAVPAFSDWIATTEMVFTYTSGKIQQILEFPPFNAWDAGVQDVAATVDIQVRRNDNVVTGDVVGKQFDIHAPFDAPLGSGQEFVK